ncbi:S9 family peptidase [Acanthopleuribacter pedis]|uniref:S9 family peptidase n=1 Tax=Acanthopleuribacter pedis TaxID=442870 RepID=A0A8J7U921_9BACT|nr:S9 family peptidase [Acanthopleuribacter pedis]MBO1323196.1 S9 family peptidase [Acanthopleuribacter pedis]
MRDFLPECAEPNVRIARHGDGAGGPEAGPVETVFIPPFAKQLDHVHEQHGHRRNDPYFWLNERENPEVIKYLEDENRYTDAYLHEEEVDALYEEMVARLKKDDQSVPYQIDDYHYYTRFESGKEYAVFCRRPGAMDGAEEVLLDENVLAEGHAYFSVSARSLTADHQMLAFAQDTVGRRIYDIRFKDLRDGRLLEDTLVGTGGDIAWAADGTSLFYTTQDENTLRTDRVYRHVLGTPQSEDQLVFFEEDETYYSFVYRSTSKQYIIIGSSSTLSTEYRFLRADQPEGAFQVFHPRESDHRYSIFHGNDHFYVLSNKDADNYKLMRTGLTDTDAAHWETVLAHRAEVFLEGMQGFVDHLVVQEREQGLTRPRVIALDGSDDYYIEFEEPTYIAELGFNPMLDTGTLRFTYESLTTPLSVFEYDMVAKTRTLLKRDPVLGDFDPADYVTERVWTTSDDGKKIPMSVVYHRDTPRDGSAPLLEYGYGSYGISCDPHFSPALLSLLNRGWVYAIAHIRGGADLGRPWYLDGKLLKKWHTFDDFAACGKYLVKAGYAAPDRLFARGGSAGGMLMGVMANKYNDLYAGIVAVVPFVDCVTTMLDDTIPLTTFEYDEWGNPNDKEFYDYMLSYSPYDQVVKQSYPAMLVTTGLHDSQVQYWEPAKWVAKLRTHKQDGNLLLMHTNMDAGHGGASGRFRRYRETAREYLFLIQTAEKIAAAKQKD